MTRDRYRGALLGLAVSDALGATLEFKPPGTFVPITDMIGGGPFGLNPGEWMDDTSMALCRIFGSRALGVLPLRVLPRRSAVTS
jgi:ADP-ribosylglycohydrolase